MAFAYDFYTPFFSCAIIDPDGNRFPLWTDLTNLSTTTLDKVGLSIRSLPFVTELSVELNLNYLPEINASLEPPYRDAMAFLDSSVVEWSESVFECQFGYIGGADEKTVLSPIFDGILLKPEIQMGSDIKINLVAKGSSAYSSAYTEQHSLQTFTLKRSDWIRFFAAGPTSSDTTVNQTSDPRATRGARGSLEADRVIFASGRKIEVDFSAVVTGSDEYNLLLEKVTLNVGGTTDWYNLINMVRDSFCWALIVDKKIKILPRSNFGKGSEKPKVFRFFDYQDGVIAPLKNEFPILSWGTETMAAFYSGVRGLLLRDINSKTRQFQDQLISDALVAIPRTGQGAGEPPVTANNPGIDPKTNNGASQASGSPNDSARVNATKAELASIAGQMGINLTFDTLGIPDLIPGEVIALRGLGVRFDGNYGVLSVKHVLNSSGYMTSVDCVSNVGQLYDKFLARGPIGQVAPPPPPQSQFNGQNWTAGETFGFDKITPRFNKFSVSPI